MTEGEFPDLEAADEYEPENRFRDTLYDPEGKNLLFFSTFTLAILGIIFNPFVLWFLHAIFDFDWGRQEDYIYMFGGLFILSIIFGIITFIISVVKKEDDGRYFLTLLTSIVVITMAIFIGVAIIIQPV